MSVKRSVKKVRKWLQNLFSLAVVLVVAAIIVRVFLPDAWDRIEVKWYVMTRKLTMGIENILNSNSMQLVCVVVSVVGILIAFGLLMRRVRKKAGKSSRAVKGAKPAGKAAPMHPVHAPVNQPSERVIKITHRGQVQLKELREQFAAHPTDFEHYVAKVFDRMGYRTEVTQASNDGGIDIKMEKNAKRYVVEVKLYAEGNNIGREKIQKLHSAYIDANANGAIFVTTSDYTASAVEYAQRQGIELVNGARFVEMANMAFAR